MKAHGTKPDMWSRKLYSELHTMGDSGNSTQSVNGRVAEEL
jgi:hypothetical protein